MAFRSPPVNGNVSLPLLLQAPKIVRLGNMLMPLFMHTGPVVGRWQLAAVCAGLVTQSLDRQACLCTPKSTPAMCVTECIRHSQGVHVGAGAVPKFFSRDQMPDQLAEGVELAVRPCSRLLRVLHLHHIYID